MDSVDSTTVLQHLANLSRREFLSKGASVAGWGAFATVLATGAVETLNFFFPRVIFNPPSRFNIGTPEEFVGGGDAADRYGVILVDQRWKSSQRFFIVREPDRIYATFARCTHLGCTVTVRWR